MSDGGIANTVRKKQVTSVIRVLQLLLHLRRMYRREEHGTDIIHVNWLQNALPMGNSPKPLLVTVLGTDMKMLAIPGMIYMLRRVFRKRPCFIAPNAEWMEKDLSRHFGDVATVRTIPFGIDTPWYEIGKTRQSQYASRDADSIFVVVLRITPEKIGKLFDWGERLFSGTGRTLHLFGPIQREVEIPAWVNYHGATNPSELQDKWFARATALITLSEHDEGRPQIILEAMASGLPVIASDIDAHRDMIVDGETGWLCADEDKFHSAVEQAIDPSMNTKVAECAGHWIQWQVGTWDDCAARYYVAYDELAGCVV
jgi:glycosyltransferase involved in cell wall biosynthesis